ncbi:hypothetical protein NVP2275O_315 [Vibrio phage 2.275.O._10N.286.54.E11]|nr:hypothetical protein NVP2275O_315 [Vibrio phage 2.275.O._10N.286.54.E11]
MSKLITNLNSDNFDFEDILYLKTRLKFKFKNEPEVNVDLSFYPHDRDYGFTKRFKNSSKWEEYMSILRKAKNILKEGLVENLELETYSTGYYAVDSEHRTISRKGMSAVINSEWNERYRIDTPIESAEEVILWTKMVLLGK